MFKVLTYVGGGYAANSHLVIETESGHAVLFDAAMKSEKLKEKLSADSLTLDAIILTHGHYDHTVTLSALKAAFPQAKLLVGKGDAVMYRDLKQSCADIFGVGRLELPECDGTLDEGDEITVGNGKIKVISTPGHTPGSLCFETENFMITGDTLFAGGVGRYDLPLGDRRVLIKTLDRLAEYPFEGKIYPGHGNTSTLKNEKLYNPYLNMKY